MSNSSWPWANEQGVRRQDVLMAYCRQTEKATCDGTFSGYGLIFCHSLLLLFQKAYFSFERFSHPLQALLLLRMLLGILRFFWRKSSHTTNTPSGIFLNVLEDICWLISEFAMPLLEIDLISAVVVSNKWVNGLVPPGDELVLVASFIWNFGLVSLDGINSGVVGLNSDILGCDEHPGEKGPWLKLLAFAHWGTATFDSTILDDAMVVLDALLPLGQTGEVVFLAASSEDPCDKEDPNLGNSSSDDIVKQASGCWFESVVRSLSLSFDGNSNADDNAGELDDSLLGGR